MSEQMEMFSDDGIFLAKLRSNWSKTIEEDGGHCPCCGKWGKVYKTKLSQHLALCLKWIASHEGEDGWADVQNNGPRWMLKSKTYPLLEHWKMIEYKERRSGCWRVTTQGHEFLRGRLMVPASVLIYDNRIWGVDNESVSFRDCFGRHFDFDALMSDPIDWANVIRTKE